MLKPVGSSSFLGTLSAYCSSTTVHGLSHVGNKSLPVVDRILWLAVVAVFGSCAVYISSEVYQEWRSNKVVTTLKETELPVTQLDFPAITICSEGVFAQGGRDCLAHTMQKSSILWA